MLSAKPGHLSGVNRDRKIDTWKFYGDSKKAVDISFDVYITPKLGFRLETKDIAEERLTPLEGPDLAQLHKQAEKLAIDEFNLRNELVWTDWLEICVKAMTGYDRRNIVNGSQACVSYRVIPRGETPDGTAYTIVGDTRISSLVKFPKPTMVDDNNEMGMREVSAEEKARIEKETPPNSSDRLSALLHATDQRSPDIQFSYLPDTPENRAGLDAIIAVINNANLRLQQFLSSENLPDTLERARNAGVNLLAAPEPARKSPKP